MLNVSQDLLSVGLSTAVVLARGVASSPTPSALADYRRAVGRQLSAYWNPRSLSSAPALREYERVHRLFAVADEPSAPEKLLRYVRRHQDFTAAGAIVDCYNLVSGKTLLSIGAHDLAKLKTPITLRPVVSTDVFVPLGEKEPKSCSGESRMSIRMVASSAGWKFCRPTSQRSRQRRATLSSSFRGIARSRRRIFLPEPGSWRSLPSVSAVAWPNWFLFKGLRRERRYEVAD